MILSATASTAAQGKILWTVDIPGTADSVYAYGFSDSTSPSPITDGTHVYFYNCSGSVGCWDMQGKSTSGCAAGSRRKDAPSTNSSSRSFSGIPCSIWNRVTRATRSAKAATLGTICVDFDKNTGKTLWVADDSLTHYNTPMIGTLARWNSRRACRGAAAITTFLNCR